MKFQVEYKDGGGATRRETFDASSREACFDALRLRKIAPIRVTEVCAPLFAGGCKRNLKRPGPRSLAAMFCIAAVLGAVLLLAIYGDDKPEAKRIGTKARKQEPRIAFHPAAPAEVPAVQATEDGKDLIVPGRVNEDIAPQEPDTGKWQVVNGFKVPKGARLVRNSLTNKQERIFATASDALIASYLQPPVNGTMPPPLPVTGDAGRRFLESLEVPVEIKDTDSEDVRRQKESVIIARAQIKDMMDQGYSFEEILSEHYRLAEENNRIRKAAQKELNGIYMSGDADGAERYRKMMDAAMSQMGIDPLDEPMTLEERREIKRLRREAREMGIEE